MSTASALSCPSVKEQVSPEEWEQRVNLAACYRLVALYGFDDLIFTHISARVPGPEHHFLINPYGMTFDEITASSLVKVDMQCNKLIDSPFPVNPAGFVIHSAVHEVRPDAGCVLHTHTRAGVAVSAQKCGVLPISQQSTFVLGSLAYHAYEGVAFRDEEKPRLQADLGYVAGKPPKGAAFRQALDAASSTAPAEGSVGGGTGMNCYGFKGGNGTASRIVPFGETSYTVGVFVQANFGERAELTVNGVRVGARMTVENPLEDTDWFERDLQVPGGAGSVIVIVATDAPLNAAQCAALARRVPLGLARTGTTGSLFSGDLFLALSTANDGPSRTGFPTAAPSEAELYTTQQLPWNRIDAFHAATVHAVEEAVLNALVVNETMTGRDGHRSPALPHDQLRALLPQQ